MAAQIYQMIYQNVIPKKEEYSQVISGSTTQTTTNGKKEELVESLKYLKSKPIKTKKDKESIGMIEAILQNM